MLRPESPPYAESHQARRAQYRLLSGFTVFLRPITAHFADSHSNVHRPFPEGNPKWAHKYSQQATGTTLSGPAEGSRPQPAGRHCTNWCKTLGEMGCDLGTSNHRF